MTITMIYNAIATKVDLVHIYFSRKQSESLDNLASGNNKNLTAKDARELAISSKLSIVRSIEFALATNLQNLNPFTQGQYVIQDSLEAVASGTGVLSTLATNVMLSISIRFSYRKKFTQLLDQFDGGLRSSNIGIDTYFAALPGIGFRNYIAFPTDYKSTNGNNSILTNTLSKLDTADSFSVQCSDYNPGNASVSLTDSILDKSVSQIRIYSPETIDANSKSQINSTEVSKTLPSDPPISFGDIVNFKIASVNSAPANLQGITLITDSISYHHASAGINHAIIEQQIDSVHSRKVHCQLNLSMNRDADFSSQVRTNVKFRHMQCYSTNAPSLANRISIQNALQLKTKILSFNQVFDTCLKSDEQHEVAGQKNNHGGLILCH